MIENTDSLKDIIDRFVQQFDESYRLLAYYAALPLVLTPELLNYLHAKFLRGRVVWEAQADLLLSELFNPVGYELYAMEPALREYLLTEMEKTEEAAKMEEVAHLLLSYVQHLWHKPSVMSQSELQAQRWGAMAYIKEERDNAVREMTASLQTNLNHNDKSGMIWLSRLIDRFKPQLEASQNYPNLLKYAEIANRYVNPPNQQQSIAGQWLNPAINSTIFYKQQGKQIFGIYDYGQKKKTAVYIGTLIGNWFEYEWRWLEKNLKGHGRMSLANDGKILSGGWWYNEERKHRPTEHKYISDKMPSWLHESDFPNFDQKFYQPTSYIKVNIQTGDALKFKADVLALKYAQAFYGLDEAVTDRLLLNEKKLLKKLFFKTLFQLAPNQAQLINTKGNIESNYVIFIGVPPLNQFGYNEIQVFAKKVLYYLASHAPYTQHLCVTTHGVNTIYNFNEIKSLESEITGFIEAISADDYPRYLRQITIIEHNVDRAKILKTALSKILPSGVIYVNKDEYFNQLENLLNTVLVDNNKVDAVLIINDDRKIIDYRASSEYRMIDNEKISSLINELIPLLKEESFNGLTTSQFPFSEAVIDVTHLPEYDKPTFLIFISDTDENLKSIRDFKQRHLEEIRKLLSQIVR